MKKNKEYLPACVVIEFRIIGVCLKDLSLRSLGAVQYAGIVSNVKGTRLSQCIIRVCKIYLEDTISIKKKGQFYKDTLGKVVTH